MASIPEGCEDGQDPAQVRSFAIDAETKVLQTLMYFVELLTSQKSFKICPARASGFQLRFSEFQLGACSKYLRCYHFRLQVQLRFPMCAGSHGHAG